jgi:hypothetical protein
MGSFEQLPRETTTRRSRRPRRLAAAAALAVTAGMLAAATPARAGGLLEEPCFATCGQYRWFLRKPVEVRENAACCMPLIRKANVVEERALELFEAARDPSNTSAESSDLVREANRLIAKRGRLIRKFIDCVNGVVIALGMRDRGLDPTATYAGACGVALECAPGLGQ